MPSNEMAILEGALSIQAALDSHHRRVHEIRVAHDAIRTRTVATVVRRARRRRIPVRSTPRKEIARLATGDSHGGIVAIVGPRAYQSLDTVLRTEAPFLAMLDGIEDPYNFGQAIRALYAAGADGLLLRTGHQPSADPIVARASGGASERMPTVLVPDLHASLDGLRVQNIRIACTASRTAGQIAVSCHDTDLSGPLLLVIGGERRGIARRLVADADVLVTIPYGRRFPVALDATSATAALAFEVARQRRARRHEGATTANWRA
jgi:23S rRNA (guanosine2251-2'-O)-methyltransferase